jgi:hypothetical protein
MKKIFAIIVVSMFGFAFGCGGAPVEAPAAPEAPEVEAPEVETPEAPEAPEAPMGEEAAPTE